ncbi:glycoside hydrolase family 65 protein [Bisporella sp. PMI_857]|nr:glycoside hydrolase family 65 protein [Bisporella sp. PMI_857]
MGGVRPPWRWVTLLAAGRVVQASTDFSTTSGIADWDQSDWSLTANTYIPAQYQARVSLANGYVGASLAAAGPFFEKDINQTDPDGVKPSNGWPLFDERVSFSTIAGFYDLQPNGTGTNYPWLNQYGWESFISGIPHSTGIIFAFGENYLDATASNTTISNFAQKLSFKTGVGEWAYTWTPAESQTSFNVTYSTIFSRKRPNVIAVTASITPSADINGTVTDLIDGRSALRTYLDKKGLDDESSIIYSSVHPWGRDNVTAYVQSGVNFTNAYTDTASRGEARGPFVSTDESTIGQTFNISLKAGQTATFYKYVGVASNDKFPRAEATASEAQAQALEDGWDTLLAEHIVAWGEIMTETSVDNFTDPATGKLPDDETIKSLQIASVANTFYLLENIQADGSGLNDWSISVGGLSSDSYAGLVFWDADYWMSPGLNLASPGYAKQISNFRLKQYDQALANAEFNGWPNGSALYSWTSGGFGNCTGTGPCVDYQYHLNHDIAFNLLQQYNITNNATWFYDGPADIIESVAIMSSHLLKYNATTETYWILNATDPDEYANNVNNTAFTIASAAEILRQGNWLRSIQGAETNETWEEQAENIAFLSAESNITLEFQGMNNSAAVKQADIVLLTYPLDYNDDYSHEEKLLDLDYYANRQSPNGPAMTYSIFAINANALSPSGCSAHTYTLNGFLPYLRAPWYQFSEQAVDDINLNGDTKPAFPFLTGHGGANQVVPFGFLGIRTDQPALYISPSLPPQIPFVTVRTFYYGGATLSAYLNSTHTTISRITTPASANLEDKYANTTLPFILGSPGDSNTTSYSLAINQTVTVPNRLYWQNLTDPGNLLQCLPVTSEDPYQAGQFPVAAIDGATSTRWQPYTNESASLLVNMAAVVYLGNTTDGEVLYDTTTVIRVDNITISLPYDAEYSASEEGSLVEPVQGNTTILSVQGGAWSGKYARLVIEGCFEEDGKGATVGEFVLLGVGS